MTLEAALQFVGEQLSRILKPCTPKDENPFSYWLNQLPEHDLHLKGLGTLRLFAAHIVMKPPTRAFNVLLEKTPRGVVAKAEKITQSLNLPQLKQNDLENLRSSRLDPSDLPAWNEIVMLQDAGEILEHGLRQVQEILLAAESLL